MIHPTAIIHPGVELGAGSRVGAYCVLGSENGDPLLIGDDAVIRSHTVIYGGSDYGPNLETGHYTLLRSGNTVGVNLRIGSYASLEGRAQIGDYVRIHGRYEMTQGRVGHFAHLFGGTYVTDNRRPPSVASADAVPVIDDGAVVCMGVIVVAGVSVGVGAYVAGGVVVTADVPDGHLLGRDGTLKRLRYFWPAHFAQAYPPEARPRLAALHERMLALGGR